MTSTKMELSLDDIIKTNPKVRRGGRGSSGGTGRGRGTARGGGLRRGLTRSAGGSARGFKTGGRGGLRRSNSGAAGGRFGGGGLRNQRTSSEGMWVHDKFQEGGFGGRRSGGLRTSGGGAAAGGGSKITVSNLHYGVSDADIIELFGELGPIRYASVHYDRSGRSMGKADVVFERRGDAQQAITQYNGIPLDGRSMAITFANATSVGTVAPIQRSPGLRQVAGGRIGRRSGGGGSPTTQQRRGRGGGARGAGRGGRGGATKAPTAAELDAELDAYISANPK